MLPSRRQLRWLRLGLLAVASASFVAGLGRVRCQCQDDGFASLLFALSAVALAGVLATLAVDIAREAASAPWWRTAAFTNALFWTVLWASPFLLFLALTGVLDRFGMPFEPDRVFGAVAGLIVFVLGMIPVVVMRRQRRRGEAFIDGGHDFLGMDAWCQKRLGVWWLGRFAITAGIAVFVLLYRSPVPAFAAAIPLGMSAYWQVAHALGLEWSGKQRMQAMFERRRALGASSDYRLLSRRNGLLYAVVLALMFVGLGSPYAANLSMKLYDSHDWRLMLLGFGLMGILPLLLVYPVLRFQGMGRVREFRAYLEMQSPDLASSGAWRTLISIYAALTIAGAAAVAMTAKLGAAISP